MGLKHAHISINSLVAAISGHIIILVAIAGAKNKGLAQIINSNGLLISTARIAIRAIKPLPAGVLPYRQLGLR